MPPSKLGNPRSGRPAPWPFRVIGQLIEGMIRVVREVFSLLATLVLWLAELIAGAVVRVVRLLGQAFGLVFNLGLWAVQGLANPLLGPQKKLSPQSAAAHSLRGIGLAVLVFFLVSLLPVLVPPQPGNPLWWLNLCRSVVGNGVILIFALFCLLLAFSWIEPSARVAGPGRRVQWAVRGSLALFLLMLPVQAASSVVLVSQYRSSVTAQIAAVTGRRGLAVQQVERLNDPQALVAVFRRFSRPGVTLPSPSLPLSQLRREVSLALESSADTAIAEINQQRRNRLLGLGIDGARMALSLLALSMAALGLGRWGSSQADGARTQLDSPSE